MRTYRVWLVLGAWCAAAARAAAAGPTSEEMAEARRWVAARIEQGPAPQPPPFSFTYGGQSSTELLKAWDRKHGARRVDEQRTEHALVCADPKTGLVVRCIAVEYQDFPTVEWTLHFKNTGQADTPALAAVLPLDVRCGRGDGASSPCTTTPATTARPTATSPIRLRLEPKSEHRFAPNGGRPTTGPFPISTSSGRAKGVIAVIGWPGQWAARFTRDAAAGLRISRRAGTDPLPLAPGRRGPHAAGRAAVLEGRPNPGAEPLAALDARPQPAAPGRQAPIAPSLLVQRRLLPGAQVQREGRTAVHRRLLAGKDSAWTTGGWTPAGIPAATAGPTSAPGSPTPSDSPAG